MLNQRAMEVLDDVGVADAIAQRSTPAEQMAATAYYAGFAAEDPDCGRRLARLEAWGAGGEDEFWRAASPWRQSNLPQIRLEPVLKARADELSPGRIRFNHELIHLDQDDDGVRALIRETPRDVSTWCAAMTRSGPTVDALAHRLIGVEYERARRCDADGDAPRLGGLLHGPEGSRRADPLDLLAAERRAGRDGVSDGAPAVGPRLRGMGSST